MGHRYYDPGTGRFLTRDPAGYGGGMNLYGYADGNPVSPSLMLAFSGIIVDR
jgi:RHS repeat-associated protein